MVGAAAGAVQGARFLGGDDEVVGGGALGAPNKLRKQCQERKEQVVVLVSGEGGGSRLTSQRKGGEGRVG